jgi:hypothetical protein
MNLLAFLPDFGQAFSALWWAFTHGGWAAFVFVAVYILYTLYRYEIRGQFLADQEWTFLLIKPPKENLVSTLGIEQVFFQLHALHAGLTWPQIYLEGREQLWYSFEIISLGGKVSFVVRLPKKMRDTVESAFYAQYPDAEIMEIEDYLANIEYHPGHSDFDLFGFDMKLLQEETIPIKSYKDFEHSTAEVPILDPLTPLLESMSKMNPYEFFGVQIIAQPLADPEWKAASEAKAKELLGEELPAPKETVFQVIGAALNVYNPIALISGFLSGSAEEKKEEKKEKNNLLHMTEIEKERVVLVQKKASKPGYKCKLRLMYIAPKDKFDKSRISLMVGAFRPFGDANTNGFKPNTKHWPSVEYKISPTLEAPYIKRVVEQRKHHEWEGFKGRKHWIGSEQFILNVEELATLFHLPMAHEKLQVPSAVERVESKRAQPPVNLPTM